MVEDPRPCRTPGCERTARPFSVWCERCFRALVENNYPPTIRPDYDAPAGAGDSVEAFRG